MLAVNRDLDVAWAAWRVASAKAAAARVAVTMADAQCRARICGVRDALWNALGRPHHSHLMLEVFPEGADTYAAGDSRRRWDLMEVLLQRLGDCAAPQLTAEQRQGWIADLEAARAALAQALAAHEPAHRDAAATKTTYLTAARLPRNGSAF